MTYPPQQQPDPWGQDPYGQQQPNLWGQQPGAQQYDAWGAGGYGPPPGKRGGAGKVVAIVLVVIVVLGGAGVGLFFLLKKNDKSDQAQGLNPNDPKSVATAWADLYARAYNSDYQEVKADQLKPLMCQSQYQGLDQEQQQADAKRTQGSSGGAQPTPTHPQYTLQVGNVQVNGDAATVMVTAVPKNGSTGASGSASNAQAGPHSETKPFSMKKENGGWKVCGPQQGSAGGSSSSGGSGKPSIPVPGGGGGQGQPGGSVQPLPSGLPLPGH